MDPATFTPPPEQQNLNQMLARNETKFLTRMEVKEKFEALRKIHVQEKRDLESKVIAEALSKFKIISKEICYQFSEENRYLKE